MLKKQVFYCVFPQNSENAIVLLCVRSKMLKKHWFDCVFASKCCFLLVFYCVSLKTPYTTNPKLGLGTSELAKPFVLPLQIAGNTYFPL